MESDLYRRPNMLSVIAHADVAGSGVHLYRRLSGPGEHPRHKADSE
jgi:hypothetical protein